MKTLLFAKAAVEMLAGLGICVISEQSVSHSAWSAVGYSRNLCLSHVWWSNIRDGIRMLAGTRC